MFKQLVTKFVQEEKGAPIIEIVILIAMAAVLAAFLFPTLRSNLSVWFTQMVANITNGISGTSAGNTAAGTTSTVQDSAW